MKQNYLKKLMAALLLLCSTVAGAQEFEADGIYYNVLSEEDKTVVVTGSELDVVIIPASVADGETVYNVIGIGEYAFSYDGPTSVQIPNSVTSIGNEAFFNCTSLTNINIPNSITSIGNSAFCGCTNLENVTIGNGVKTIEYFTFAGCTSLTNINIPNNVTTLEGYTFEGCINLKSVTIGNGVKTIEGSTFSDCTSLENVRIGSGVTSIEYAAFYGCTNLINITIPGSVEYISHDAFEDTGWYEMQPNGPVYCGKFLYKYKGAMPTNTDITIKEGTNVIVGCAFENCRNLTNVNIPESVTSIGYNAFYGCTGLTSIEIPSSVTSIGESAFSGCGGLTSIISRIPADKLFAPEWGALYGVDKTECTLYVPYGAAATYAATDGWNDFTSIIEFTPKEYTLTVSAAGYATMYLDYAAEIPEGVEVYTAGRIEDDRLKMQPVEDVIPANTGVIVRANEGTYSFAESSETPAAVSGNLLTGTVADTYVKPAAATAYVLSQVDGVIGMYKAKLKADGTFKNNANKAYMLLGDITTGEGNLDTSNPGMQLSAGYRFDFSGTTAIESVEAEGAAPAVYYDLSGRRVENPVKGIYIVNGHKVFIK